MDDELLAKIRKSKVYQAATNQAIREGLTVETLQRFQKNWEAELLQLIKQNREATIAEYIHKTSTGDRPLSAPPLLVKQPVPCPRCGAEEYADWWLYPHQVYNSYMPGGIGHYCFPCFAQMVVEMQLTTNSKERI